MNNFLDKIFLRFQNLDYISKNLKDITYNTPANKIFDAINSYSENSEVRYVGGCIRKVIKKEIIDDIDLATNLKPNEVCEALKKNQIKDISNKIGSDVILGIKPTSTILTSNGDKKKFLNCPKFHILLVKPDFGCSTKDIYSKVKTFTRSKYNKPKKFMFGCKYLSTQENALEKIAFLKYPKLKEIKNFLLLSNNPAFVRMTGSGSVIVAYYLKKRDCELAKVQFKRKFKNYWWNSSKTI